MYNTDLPTRAELPTSAQLRRSTWIAAITALLILVFVVLPSEYAVDPTGMGRVLGLTQMGEIKMQLAREAAQEVAAAATGDQNGLVPAPGASVAAPTTAAPLSAWRDEISFVLTPGQGAEIKLVMDEGARAQFHWTGNGAVLNYDTHGDGPGNRISYEQGRGVPEQEGELAAAFTGKHGWFWRNRTGSDVTVTLRTRGDYQDIVRVM